jgi:hypothetical protein
MKTIYIIAFLILFFTSCNNGYKFWDISKFNIVDTALANNEEIKLIYSSRAPDNNEDLKYYIQIVAVSQKSGDTVNILTTVENGFTINDKDKVFNFFDQNNMATQLIQSDLEKIKDPENVNDINSNASKRILKVARDPKFDNIADNNYPTVIGSIGTISKY